jgi:putative nucleotidyltransferase with HDIG domain
VVGASVYKTLAGLPKRPVGNYDEFWHHALACAVSSRLVATELMIRQKDHSFTAGLLHDIGRVILATLCSDKYQQVYELAAVRGCRLIEAEVEILETTHTEVGKMVAHKWNLPMTLVEPIGNHHEPFCVCSNQELVQVVYLGNIVARLAGYGSDCCNWFSPDDAVLKQWGMNYERLHLISDQVKNNVSLEMI